MYSAKGQNGKILIVSVVIAVAIWAFSVIFKQNTYIGFYYPDASNLFNDIQSKNSFDSLDACRNWVDEQKSTYNPNGTSSDDYECGKNCDLQNGQKPYVCEETLE